MEEERKDNIHQKHKECYTVEIGFTNEKELKDLIIEILRKDINRFDL